LAGEVVVPDLQDFDHFPVRFPAGAECLLRFDLYLFALGFGELRVNAVIVNRHHVGFVIVYSQLHGGNSGVFVGLDVGHDASKYLGWAGLLRSVDMPNQLGLGKNAKDALLRWGVFIAANDTFDPKNPQDWVDNGDLSDTPTEKFSLHSSFSDLYQLSRGTG